MKFTYDPKPTPAQRRSSIVAFTLMMVAAFAMAFSAQVVEPLALCVFVTAGLVLLTAYLFARHVELGNSIGRPDRDRAAKTIADEFGITVTDVDLRRLLGEKRPTVVRDGDLIHRFYYDGVEVSVESLTRARRPRTGIMV